MFYNQLYLNLSDKFMTILNQDTLLHIGSFMDPRGAVALTCVNRDLRENRLFFLKSHFSKAFGNPKPRTHASLKKKRLG